MKKPGTSRAFLRPQATAEQALLTGVPASVHHEREVEVVRLAGVVRLARHFSPDGGIDGVEQDVAVEVRVDFSDDQLVRYRERLVEQLGAADQEDLAGVVPRGELQRLVEAGDRVAAFEPSRAIPRDDDI